MAITIELITLPYLALLHIFEYVDNHFSVSRVCQLFSDLFFPKCIILDSSVNPYPEIPWKNVRHLKITSEFLKDKSADYLNDFFNDVGPNLQKLYLDFGEKPSTHSSALFLKVLNNNPNLIDVFAHVQAWGLQEFNIMTKVLSLNLHIYEISPFEGLQWEYNEDKYFPNLEDFQLWCES
jgi:hypothetical protein